MDARRRKFTSSQGIIYGTPHTVMDLTFLTHVQTGFSPSARGSLQRHTSGCTQWMLLVIVLEVGRSAGSSSDSIASSVFSISRCPFARLRFGTLHSNLRAIMLSRTNETKPRHVTGWGGYRHAGCRTRAHFPLRMDQVIYNYAHRTLEQGMCGPFKD